MFKSYLKILLNKTTYSFSSSSPETREGRDGGAVAVEADQPAAEAGKPQTRTRDPPSKLALQRQQDQSLKNFVYQVLINFYCNLLNCYQTLPFELKWLVLFSVSIIIILHV